MGISLDRYRKHIPILKNILPLNLIGKLLFFLTLHGTTFAQAIPKECQMVEPVQLILTNDKHQANYNQAIFGASYCVEEEVAAVELCLPVGIVAGDVSLTKINSFGRSM